MEKHKLFVIVVSLFLGTLFLSTIGSYWTGYTTLENSEISLNLYPYPFLKYSNYNSLYIVIPDHSTLKEEEIANNLAESLKSTKPLYPKIVKLSELPGMNNNLILIGDSCTNPLMKYSSKLSCTFNLKEGEGFLKLINKEKYSMLLVSGYDLESMKKAANVLINYNLYPLKGNEIIVSGNPNNLYTYYLFYKN